MAQKQETVWEEPEHSNAKRVILRKYFEAYFPILLKSKSKQQHTRRYHELNIVDGFSGPGHFESENPESGIPREMGSPIVAFMAALGCFAQSSEEFNDENNDIAIHFYWCEKDPKRCAELKDKIKKSFDMDEVREILPSKDVTKASDGFFSASSEDESKVINITVYNLTFEKFSEQVFESINRYLPTFVFIDPFGFRDIPFDSVQEFLAKMNKIEVFVNLMVQPIQRAIGRASLLETEKESVTPTLGTDEWRMIKEKKGRVPRDDIRSMYERELHKCGMQYFLNFTMANKRNVPLYELIFATKHPKGVEVMKESMNRVTQDKDEFKFSSFMINTNQIPWKSWKNEQDKERAAQMIYDQFKAEKSVTVERIKLFVLLKTQYVFRKKQQLKSLFNEGKIQLVWKVSKDKPNQLDFNFYAGTFPDEGLVSFIEDHKKEILKPWAFLGDILGESVYKKDSTPTYFSAEEVKMVFKHSFLSANSTLSGFIKQHNIECWKKQDKDFIRSEKNCVHKDCFFRFDN